MKKRLLALALCLVMMTSLLPLSAAAEEFTVDSVNSVHVVGSFCDWVFSGSNLMQAIGSGVYELTIFNANHSVFDGAELKFAINGGWTHSFGGTFISSGVKSNALYGYNNDSGLIMLVYPYSLANITFRLDLSQFNSATKEGATFTITITDPSHNFDTGWTSDETHHWHKCLNAGCTEVKDKALHFDNNNDHFCDDCGASVHTWQFKAAGNTLTGYCGGANCDIKEIVLTLKADSVTLPKSPFETAELVGWKAFTDAIPSAYYNSFDYKLNGEDVTDKSNPKAGNYQVGVRIYGLPSPVEYSGVAARANMDGNGYSAYLYTQYTAVDPAVTAQTGDNRPIELMVGSVVVFSALAAAAFIVDSKRRSQH